MNKQESYRQYFLPEVLAKIQSFQLKTSMVVEGFMIGLHKSPYHGFSVEFSQHRPYTKGDSIRDIDWKVYAKREKYFVKQYEEETNLICNILLDRSRSMGFRHQGAVSKLEYAKMLSGALSYLALNQQDACGLFLFSDTAECAIPAKSSLSNLNKILMKISEAEALGKTNTVECLGLISEKIKRKSLVVIISDLLDDQQKIFEAVRRFHFRKNEVLVFQVLDKSEIDFSFPEEGRFVDMETGTAVSGNPSLIRESYTDAMSEYLHKIRSGLLSIGVDYELITTSTPLDRALLSYFKKRAKLS